MFLSYVLKLLHRQRLCENQGLVFSEKNSKLLKNLKVYEKKYLMFTILYTRNKTQDLLNA